MKCDDNYTPSVDVCIFSSLEQCSRVELRYPMIWPCGARTKCFIKFHATFKKSRFYIICTLDFL